MREDKTIPENSLEETYPSAKKMLEETKKFEFLPNDESSNRNLRIRLQSIDDYLYSPPANVKSSAFCEEIAPEGLGLGFNLVHLEKEGLWIAKIENIRKGI
jgi:hypothetical protein